MLIGVSEGMKRTVLQIRPLLRRTDLNRLFCIGNPTKG